MKKAIQFLLLVGMVNTCFGMAYYAGTKEMIQKADAIVVVNITDVSEANKRGDTLVTKLGIEKLKVRFPDAYINHSLD